MTSKVKSILGGAVAAIAATTLLVTPANAAVSESNNSAQAQTAPGELARPFAWILVTSYYYHSASERVTKGGACIGAKTNLQLQGYNAQCVDQGDRWDLIREL
ncbi:hypothetical protein [Streptosporangium sp. NPDC020145]|uniref:hypothetical protein n=1 Tax=Streptosporangium sp. NPDC020145 TaxID=3154694 RepID=UPI003431BF0B